MLQQIKSTLKPEIISKHSITLDLNDYSRNDVKYIYKLGKVVYYFCIHDTPKKDDFGFDFNTNEKLIVLLYPKGLISFEIVKVGDTWKPKTKLTPPVPNDILIMIIQKIRE